MGIAVGMLQELREEPTHTSMHGLSLGPMTIFSP